MILFLLLENKCPYFLENNITILINIQIEESTKAAIRQRDATIQELSDNLKQMTENRDQLQSEYTTQAEALSSQVQLLQSQLKQVRQFGLSNWFNVKCSHRLKYYSKLGHNLYF